MTAHPGTRTIEFPVPGMLSESVVSWLEAGRPDGPRPKPSATVMLLRESDRGSCLEVFMLRRVASMAFAPSMWVFPGGGVDARDRTLEPPWGGPSPGDWAARLGLDSDTASAAVIAAVREVFEECGVLLAGPDAERIVADASGQEWRAERDALLSKEQSFAQLLDRRGLTLRSDLLALHDHWITPECEPRRYDTWFFAARLPHGQRADDDTTEADRSGWIRPQELLEAADRGEARVLPPTIVQLRRLAAAGSVEQAMAARQHVIPVMPVPTPTDGGIVMRATILRS